METRLHISLYIRFLDSARAISTVTNLLLQMLIDDLSSWPAITDYLEIQYGNYED